MYPAYKDKSVRFHLLSQDGKCRLRRKLYCPETGREYDFSETARGYEVAPGRYVILKKEELDQLKPDSGRLINIKSFVDLSEIAPLYFEKPYYLLGEGHTKKAFQLLVRSMKEMKQAAIATFVMREKEYLAALRVVEQGICLYTMRFHDEVRNFSEFVDNSISPKKKLYSNEELKLARELIESLKTSFEIKAYSDQYRQRVHAYIDSKAKGAKFITSEEREPAPTKVVDLMKVLKKSLQEKKKARSVARTRKKAAN
jgi:DNA end-binding protein Ku